MSKPQTNQITFANQDPPWQVSQLDADITTLYGAINDWNTYGLYVIDSGTANNLAVTLPTGLTATYAAGLTFDLLVANNSTATNPTLNVDGLGAQTILDFNGNALAPSALLAGSTYRLIYDGVNFRVYNPTIQPFVVIYGGGTGQLLTLQSTASGNSSLAYMASEDSTGLRYGYVGKAATDAHYYIAAQQGELRLGASTTTRLNGWGPVAAGYTDMTPDRGTFTGTLSGFTGTVQGTFSFQRQGNQCIIYYPGGNLTGTSNTSGMSLTGMPASTIPGTTNVQQALCASVIDAGAATLGLCNISSAGFSFTKIAQATLQSTLFTASSTKGITTGMQLVYSLV